MESKPDPPKKKSNQIMVSLGLYEREMAIVEHVMDGGAVTLSAAVRMLIRQGGKALGIDY